MKKIRKGMKNGRTNERNRNSHGINRKYIGKIRKKNQIGKYMEETEQVKGEVRYVTSETESHGRGRSYGKDIMCNK